MPKKVFLCTDTCMQQRSYYVVAGNETQAEEFARKTPFPDYLDHDRDSHMEIVDCTVNEEVITITLVKIGTLSDASPEMICLIPIETKDANDYQGYVVEDDKVDITVKRTYSKTEWQLFKEE
jgi:hypothetical protein